ncbi:hypothetical protein RAS1_40130 [Phycisphaerae bacterium RAS1]|nr:hypothetical protein RAS1_40130 [Phycisphaerae bacterium RAS1]
MSNVTYGSGSEITPHELGEFYARLKHDLAAKPEQIRKMMSQSAAFVTARADGRLIGVARGVADGLRGYLTECKLDAEYQGPAALSRTDGRIEHDAFGIARELARRVLEKMRDQGVQRIDVVAWGTEVDFLEELGFRKRGGWVGMSMRAEDLHALAAAPVGVSAGSASSGFAATAG